MNYASPSTSVELTFNIGDTGLVGTAGVRVLDGQGATTTARVTTGIVETPASSGIYVATITAPATTGQFSVVFDDGAGTPTYLEEPLTVTATSMVSVVSDDFTYDITTTLGKVRFEVGDTDEAGALFTDAEIEYKLGEHGDGVLLTAAALCDVLATRFASDYTFKTDDQQFNRSDLAKAYTARAEALRTRAQNESNGGIAVVGFTRTDAHSSDISVRDGEGSSAGRVRAGYSDPDLPD